MVYEFSPFRLDQKKRRLMCGDELIPLSPKEFEVLLLLVENAGRVVEKDQLLDRVWKDTFVEEGSLTRHISWLRKKLNAHGPPGTKLIETLPKRGYRFLPEVISTGGAVLIIEEQTIQHIEIEEFEEVAPSPVPLRAPAETLSTSTLKALPGVRRRRFSLLWLIPVVLLLAGGTFFVYRRYFVSPPPKVLWPAKIAPFSGLPGRESFPAFSPDGKQLVFSWDGGIEGHDLDLYVKLIGTGDPLRLTNDPADDIYPAFAPDGRSIAFLRTFPTHNEIVQIPALGGAERKLVEQASYASLSYSPDGKFLASAELDPAGGNAGIFALELQSGARMRLTTPLAPAVDHTPRYSPDGKSLAFIRYFGSFRREVLVLPATGGEPRQLTADNARVLGLAWTADSRSLYFTSFRQVDQLNLWQVAANGGEEPKLIPTSGKGLQTLALSPDGRTLALVEESADENIWDLVPGKPERRLIRSTRADHSQEFSPDGRQIVFASDRTGNYEIWLANADGTGQRPLTNSTASAGSPHFSPDGRQILFDAQTSGTSDIFVISVNGGNPRRLTDNSKNNSLGIWSPDGKGIFFLSNRSGSDQIWKMPAGGGDAVQLTTQGAFELAASPDGKTIYYSKGAGKSGLWRVSVDGHDEGAVPELAEAGGWRSWTVNRRGIYYTAAGSLPPFRIRFFDLATRQTKEVAQAAKPPLAYYANLCVSSDGTKFLYAQEDQSASSIILVELR